jgi:hypothetical protein
MARTAIFHDQKEANNFCAIAQKFRTAPWWKPVSTDPDTRPIRVL